MEYQVPQFIEVEDKIFGPLTLRQFIFVAGGIGLTAIFMLNLPFIFGVLLSLPVLALAGALAFFKINGKPFTSVLESAFTYYLGRRLYLWKREDRSATVVATPQPAAPEPLLQAGLSRRKLEELAWSLDVKDQAPPAQ